MTNTDNVQGVFQSYKKGGGFLRNPQNSFRPSREDIWVSHQVVRKYRLTNGAEVTGVAQKSKKGKQLVDVNSVFGISVNDYISRIPFDRLAALNPDERIPLGKSKNETMRIIDMIAPVAKGTRGLIVSPPRAGKTTILEQLANTINEIDPDIKLIAMLVDERPEEVTQFQRNVKAEVLASSNDQRLESHINLVELTLSHIRVALECGLDVVVLVDSITRLARAFNQHQPGTRRTLSGGLDANALEIPRRFFGLARNVENGGSVTVIATALVQTGSRMDDYIFEEFKGTGNSEIILDRELADARIFPAINVLNSGTRREELLFNEEEVQAIRLLRRKLLSYDPKEAMQRLLKFVKQVKSNDEMFQMLLKDEN